MIKKYYYPNKYSILYNSLGGTNVSDLNSPYLPGSIVYIILDIPTKGYNTFDHWEDWIGNSYEYGDSLVLNSNLTLLAQWNPIQYTVHYYNYTPTTSSYTDQYYYFSNEHESHIVMNPGSYSGYVFQGWYTQPNGQGVEITSITSLYFHDYEEDNIILYGYWTLIATGTVTVASTNNCSISIDGISDGSKICIIGSNVTGIVTTPATNYQVVGYTILPEHGTSYRINVGNNIVMPSDNITITPISQVVESSRRFTMLGYGSNLNQVAVYDLATQLVTTTYISADSFTAYNDLNCEWSRADIVNQGPPVECKINIPYYYEGSMIYIGRTGTGNYGDTIHFVFGLSEQENTYEPYGFEVSETIDDTLIQKTIIVGTQASIIGMQGGKGVNTTNAVCGSITLLYPTNVRCLVIPKSST